MFHMRIFIGRKDESKQLETLWFAKQTKLISFYGRRRVGKTRLIKTFCENKPHLYFEGLEDGDTQTQVAHFLNQLAQQLKEPHLKDLSYTDWPPVFELLFQKISAQKNMILVFDEFPWMASGRVKLVSFLKHYWDKSFKEHPHLLIILCGSAASWMLKNIVRSNALYGRTSENILVAPLDPREVREFVGKKRGQKEVLEYLMCFGGIPRYLEEFDFNDSLQLNIERTCFERSGFFIHEAEKIFYSQFKEIRIYQQICKLLMEGPLSLHEISTKLKIPSGGGLKQYLKNLEAAVIIESSMPIKDFKPGKNPLYYLTDEFIRFDHYFIQPHLELILKSKIKNLFLRITAGKWPIFLGLAFERFCFKNRYLLAQQLGFEDKVVACGPVFGREKKGYQYDLVFLRNDGVISLCEMKYQNSPLGPSLIAEMESKLKRSSFPKNTTIEKILISNQDPSNALEESRYFHKILNISDIWKQGKEEM